MVNFNMAAYAKPVVQQRRFRLLLIGLVTLSLALGIAVVPFEMNEPRSHIRTWFDGIWWSVITVSGVGYGDMVPVSLGGRIIGIVLVCVGVLAFGLILSMFGMALSETKDRYYRLKMFEQLDDLQMRLDRLEKNEAYMVRHHTEQVRRESSNQFEE